MYVGLVCMISGPATLLKLSLLNVTGMNLLAFLSLSEEDALQEFGLLLEHMFSNFITLGD